MKDKERRLIMSKKKEINQESTPEEITKKAQEVIAKLRPYLQNDGGDVEFKKYENGVVYVSLKGACSNCPMATMTLQDGIESALINEIPEVIKVVNED